VVICRESRDRTPRAKSRPARHVQSLAVVLCKYSDHRAYAKLTLQVIQGTQQLGANINIRAVPPVGHDPDFYCEQLIPPEASRKHSSSYDVILVYRAKLVELLKTWYRKRSNLWNRGPNASFDLKRLASATNDQLDEWMGGFGSFETVTRDQSRQLIMFYDFARVMVNSHAVKKLEPGLPDTEHTRRSCLSTAIESGFDFMQRCLECSPKQFASMPTYDLNVRRTREWNAGADDNR
jgi:hypothetical protein